MEQRNGRIDRKLQPNPEVFCRYFFYHDRPEDRIIAALVKKTKTIREELGSLSQVIDAKVDDLLKTGIRRNEIRVLEQEIESADLDAAMRATVSEELEASRERQTELRRQIERLTNLLASSQKTINFSQSHFRTAISCALGAEPLTAGKDENGLPEWKFPALDHRAGADPTWAATLDSLRQPRKRGEKFWDWRRDSPIRPVVFEDPGRVTDEVVQLHLEHRVVQRLLSRFTSQGFVHHDLSRACMAQTADATPRVLLIARLALYGPGAARLHEELIAITARWIDPAIRKEPPSPYGRDREAFTMRLLDQALLEKHARTIPDVVISQLQAAAPRDIAELLSYVQQRGEEFARDAKGKLEKRAEAESKVMREILEAQKKRLIETAEKWDRNPQLT
ncbi:MAG TPA: hypothetical protein VG345_01365 [Bryobacteraceae bacterium]|jgi:hypothetical protein|nr:hypothetical protein [Bryobacteraceae bacterium]